MSVERVVRVLHILHYLQRCLCWQARKLSDESSFEHKAFVSSASRLCELEKRVAPAVASLRLQVATRDLHGKPGFLPGVSPSVVSALSLGVSMGAIVPLHKVGLWRAFEKKE